jgi:hypothetical protein
VRHFGGKRRSVLKKNGRHEETRTPDLYPVKAAFRRNSLYFNGTHCQFVTRSGKSYWTLIGPRFSRQTLHIIALKAGALNVTPINYRSTDALDGVLGIGRNTLLCPDVSRGISVLTPYSLPRAGLTDNKSNWLREWEENVVSTR